MNTDTILTIRDDLSTDSARRNLVRFISATIEADMHRFSFEPYMPNQGDTRYWTVDSGNDWKVRFFDDAPHDFEIIYRYQHGQNVAEQALAGWLRWRLGATIKQP